MTTPRTMAEFTPALACGFTLRVRYTNWRGETADRTIRIMSAPLWTSTDWHPEPQWMVWAFDVGRNERRMFAIKDIVPLEV